jgi:hypothetical protein
MSFIELIFYAEPLLTNPRKLDLDGEIKKLRHNPDLILMTPSKQYSGCVVLNYGRNDGT